MKRIILFILAIFYFSTFSIKAVIPFDVHIVRNGIVVYEAIGPMDCPLYLDNYYSGTITYEWYRKIRKFGEESPAPTPFRSAECKYSQGRLTLYKPSDRSYVYRFFWDGDYLLRIETYNRDGQDVEKRGFEHRGPYGSSDSDKSSIVVQTDYMDKYRTEIEYRVEKGGTYLPLDVVRTVYERGKYKNSTTAFVGWIHRDGRLEIRKNLDDVGTGWEIIRGATGFYPRGRENGINGFYGVPYPHSDFYLFERK